MIPRDADPVASCVPHCYTLDASLACSLPPGAYTIVPSTYQPGCSANFTVSLARRIQRFSLSHQSHSCFIGNGNRFGSCRCVTDKNPCVSFRKVVKIQELLGKAVKEVGGSDLHVVTLTLCDSLTVIFFSISFFNGSLKLKYCLSFIRVHDLDFSPNLL